MIGLQLLPLVQVVKAGGSGGAITKSGNQAKHNICMIHSSGECDTFAWASSSGTAYTSSLTICMLDSYIS